MSDLLPLDRINACLLTLVEEQDEPSGCQVVFMPTPGGACYTMQIAFRGQRARCADVRKFLRDGSKMLRAGGRMIILRSYRVEVDTDFEHRKKVTAGILRLYAADTTGGVSRMGHREEAVSLAALARS